MLLNLNLDASQHLLDDYLEAHNLELGADSSRSGETFTWESFRTLYLLILKNQSGYFREIYNGKDPADLDINLQLKDNNNNVRVCFDEYDTDKSGYLSYAELKVMLTEMNLHKQFATWWNPQFAFDNFVQSIWVGFDANMDDKISFEEFIKIFNAILDK